MIVEAARLTQHRGRRAVLDRLDLRIGRGSTALLGPNGAGKTTLLETIVTLRPPRDGKLSVCGHDAFHAAGVRHIRQEVGFLPQHFRAIPGFSLLDMISYAGWTKGVPSRHLASSAREALDVVDLMDRQNDKVGRLSGGMLQRLGIACALVHKPTLLVLDEPTVGLDPSQRANFRKLVRSLSRDTSILLSTHITDDVSAACASVIILHEGTIRFEGATDSLTNFGTEAPAGSIEEGVSELERGYLRVLHGSGGAHALKGF